MLKSPLQLLLAAAIFIFGLACGGEQSGEQPVEKPPQAPTETPTPTAEPPKATPQATTPANAPPGIATGDEQILYSEDFQAVETGQAPASMMVLGGDFAVADFEGNRALELPGAPLDDFSVLFGRTESENIVVQARIRGERKGRLLPRYGIGVNGLRGFILWVTPGHKSLQLMSGEEPLGEAPYEWTSGEWTVVRLQVRKTGDAQWVVEGKAWPEGASEPAEWMVRAERATPPIPGKPVLWGTPYSGQPIRYDDVRMERAQ